MTLRLTPRTVAGSVDELIAGATDRRPFDPDDARSGTHFEYVVIDGERFVLKHVHLDDDFTMRVSGDLGCRPLRVWEAGLVDAAPDVIDHAIVGAARGDGRNGWGAALLLRDVGRELVPVGDDPLPAAQHAAFLDHLAAMSARLWGWHDDLGLLPHAARWQWFRPSYLETERALGWPEDVPRIAAEGWLQFATRVPGGVYDLVTSLLADPAALSDAVRSTPQTFLHGDWKLGNLGTADRRPDRAARLGLPRRRAGVPRAGLVPGPEPGPVARRRDQGIDHRGLPDRARAARRRDGRVVGPPTRAVPPRRPRAVRLGEGPRRRRRAALVVRAGGRRRAVPVTATLAGAYSATGAAWEEGPGRVYNRLAEVLVEHSPVPVEGRTVLDLGAGTGAASRAIARARGSPVALDLAFGMLAEAGRAGRRRSRRTPGACRSAPGASAASWPPSP